MECTSYEKGYAWKFEYHQTQTKLHCNFPTQKPIDRSTWNKIKIEAKEEKDTV